MINESHRVIDEIAGRLKVAAEQLQQYAVSDHSIPFKAAMADFGNWCHAAGRDRSGESGGRRGTDADGEGCAAGSARGGGHGRRVILFF